VQLYRYSVSQSSEICRHNPLSCFSASVYCCCLCLFRYRISPGTFGCPRTFNKLVWVVWWVATEKLFPGKAESSSTVYKFSIVVFWVVVTSRTTLPPSSGWSEDKGNKFLRNVGTLPTLPHHYTTPKPRAPRLETSWQWKPQISQQIFPDFWNRKANYFVHYKAVTGSRPKPLELSLHPNILLVQHQL
jgi:hypothetical protein